MRAGAGGAAARGDLQRPEGAAVRRPELGTKEGCASTYTILFLVAWGDSSITAAAREGDISQIKQTNYEMFNILGIYQRYTTIVVAGIDLEVPETRNGELASAPVASGSGSLVCAAERLRHASPHRRDAVEGADLHALSSAHALPNGR